MATTPEEHRYVARRFSDNLLLMRGQANVSQEELGFMASLHRTEIGQLESGSRLPRIDTIVKLAGALKVEPGDFFTGMGWTAGDPRPGSLRVSDALGRDRVQRAEPPGSGGVAVRGDRNLPASQPPI
jgi:transcriptional regulator with XRE-family HTH domain